MSASSCKFNFLSRGKETKKREGRDKQVWKKKEKGERRIPGLLMRDMRRVRQGYLC